jgi:hypothetical protein
MVKLAVLVTTSWAAEAAATGETPTNNIKASRICKRSLRERDMGFSFVYVGSWVNRAWRGYRPERTLYGSSKSSFILFFLLTKIADHHWCRIAWLISPNWTISISF